MPHLRSLGAIGLVIGVFGGHPAAARAAAPGTTEAVAANDNTRPSGQLHGSTRTIRLRAASRSWQPEGSNRPALMIDAFGEEGGSLSVPAPLIRITEGETLTVSVRNELTASLRVHGLCTRDGSPCGPLDVPPHESREVHFEAGRAGTYHYWATTLKAPVPFRELAGALVVDPPEGAPNDRVFVITEWSDLTAAQLVRIVTADVPSEAFLAAHPRLTFVINGLSWPATERLLVRRGEPVRWRVINLSSQPHPMHLHGFYFTVLRTGDGRRDEPVAGVDGRRVVTQLLPSGATMLLQWTPEREGNWLFHCHVMHHVSPERRLTEDPTVATGSGSEPSARPHHGQDPSLGMAGMVLGVTVLPSAAADSTAPKTVANTPARRLTMVIRPVPTADGRPGAGFLIAEGGSSGPDSAASSPGPPLVLRRGEPVEITVTNQLTEGTSVHWHGLELDSYYDGVHGWSGVDRRVAPMIAPGQSFVVRIAPPRAGTFIYHTHLHDYHQLSSGLYGPIVVTEPDETFDAAVDHIVVLGRRDASEAAGILEDAASSIVNGEREPRWTWAAGRRHRVRIINITPDDVLTVSLVARTAPVTWRPLTKDGAPVPTAEVQPVPAQVRIAVGETYDFEYEAPAAPATLWLEVRSGSGKWQTQGRVIVR